MQRRRLLAEERLRHGVLDAQRMASKHTEQNQRTETLELQRDVELQAQQLANMQTLARALTSQTDKMSELDARRDKWQVLRYRPFHPHSYINTLRFHALIHSAVTFDMAARA